MSVQPLNQNFVPASRPTILNKLPGIFARNDKGSVLFDEKGVIQLNVKDFSIFSEAFIRSHLDGMTINDMKNMDQAYVAMRDKLFAPLEADIVTGKLNNAFLPNITLVIGNNGAGRSRYIKDQKPQAVICSADDAMMAIPSFQGLCQELFAHANSHGDQIHEHVRSRMAEATEKYRPAAQLMVALLMQEAIANNLPVVAEFTGKSSGIVEMINNMQRNKGIRTDVVFVMADEDTCKKACAKRYSSFSPICVSPERVSEDHKKVMKNIPAIAQAVNGDIVIMARYAPNKKLETVLVSRPHSYEVANEQILAAYEQHFGKFEGMSIEALMGGRWKSMTHNAPVFSLNK